MTRAWAKSIDKESEGRARLRGHYIIDHEEGTWLTVREPDASGLRAVHEERHTPGARGLLPDWSPEGSFITDPPKIARAVGPNAMGHPVVVLYRNAGRVLAAEPHSVEAMRRMDRWLEQRMRAHGAASVALAVDDASHPGAYQEIALLARQLQNQNRVADRSLLDAATQSVEPSTLAAAGALWRAPSARRRFWMSLM